MLMSQTISQMRRSLHLWENETDFSKYDKLLWVENANSKGFALSGRAVVDLKPSKNHYRLTHLALDMLHYSSKYLSATVYGICTPEVFRNKIYDISKEYEFKLKNLVWWGGTKEDDMENLLKELVLLFNTSCVFQKGVSKIPPMTTYAWPSVVYSQFQIAIMEAIIKISNDHLTSQNDPSKLSSLAVKSLLRNLSFERLDPNFFRKILEIVISQQRPSELLEIFLKQSDLELLILTMPAQDSSGNTIFHHMAKKAAYFNELKDLLEINPNILKVRNVVGIGISSIEIAMEHQEDPEILVKLLMEASSVINHAEIEKWAAIVFNAVKYQSQENLATLLPWFPPESFSFKGENDDTALHLASRRDDFDGEILVLMALLCGTEGIQIINARKETILHLMAKRADCAHAIKKILEILPSPRILYFENQRGKNVFEISMENQTDLSLLEILLKIFDQKLKPLSNWPLLHLAARYQSVKNLEILISYFLEKSFFDTNEENNVPLQVAIKYHPDILGSAKALMKNLEDYDVTLREPKRKRISIDSRVLKSLFDQAREVIELGQENVGEIMHFLKNLNNYTDSGWQNNYSSLLHILMEKPGNSKHIKLLLEAGADPFLLNCTIYTYDHHAWSPYSWIMQTTERQNFFFPAIKHIRECFDQFLIDVDLASKQSITQFFNAIYHENVSALNAVLNMVIVIDDKKLTFKEAILKEFKLEVESALHLASERDNVDIVKILLEAGCDPNVIDENGLTPMKVAAMRGNLNVFRVLSEFLGIDKL